MLHQHTSILAAAACGLALLAGTASAQQMSSLPQSATSVADARSTCAARDLALITMLEDRGPNASSELLHGTLLEMVRARGACKDGQSADALRIYDAALLKLKAD